MAEEKKDDKKAAKPGKDSAKKGGGKKEKPAGQKGGGRIKLLILIVVIAGCAVPAVGMVVAIGMIPSIVMSFTDRSRNRALSVCVSAPNAAGCLQAAIKVLPYGPFNIESALSYLSQPETFIVMWGAAGLGFALFSIVPPMIGGVLANMAGMKITRLRANQKELKRIWGDDVSGGLK